MIGKIKYFLRLFLSQFNETKCPSCGNKSHETIQKKYQITKLVECNNCKLRYRIPKDSKKFLDKFYQSEYKVKNPFMTQTPSDEEIEKLKRDNFPGLRRYYIDVIQSLAKGKPVKIVDYGCSWGYYVYAMKQLGMDAEGYELSKIRAEFGSKKLGITIHSSIDDITDDNDFFFSSHVIEHLPDQAAHISLAKNRLKEDGIFVAFCPNGSQEFLERNPGLYTTTWGSLHPVYISIPFVKSIFANNPYIIFTGDDVFDLDKVKKWDGVSQVVDEEKSGYELLIIAKPNVVLS